MPTNSQLQLRIRLLGEFDLHSSDPSLAPIDKSRLQSLLAFLAINRGAPQQRAKLAFSFWPDSDEKQALANLRNLLHSLRQSLPNPDAFLDVDGRTITWKAEAPFSLDVAEFETATQRANDAMSIEDLETAQSELARATSLYSDDLLPTLDDEWIEPERERLRLQLVNALSKLVHAHAENREFDAAIRFAEIHARRDPLSESTQHTLIELNALKGDRAAAINAYKNCAALLEEELDITPGKPLRDLYQAILDGEYDSVSTIERRAIPNNRKSATAPLRSNPDHIDSSENRARLSPRNIVLVGIAIIVSAIYLWPANISRISESIDKSVAVLPFENRSNREEDSFFTDGIHDDLITQISRIRDIKTISRTSVMGYRNDSKNIRSIGKELQVGAILEGGVQRAGDEIRINVKLIDATSDTNLWAKSYTRDLTAGNIFAIQSAIVTDIAQSLKAILSPIEIERIENVPTSDFAALEAYYEGRSLVTRHNTESYERAIERYEYAIAQDSEFAHPYAALAHAYLNQIYYRGISREEQIWRAKPLVEKALELNEQLGEAHSALGTMLRYTSDWSGAVEAYKKAIELNPNDAQTYYQYGNIVEWQIRDPETALELKRRAVELDPENYGNKLILNSSLANLGRIDEAQMILEAIIRDEPDNAYAYYDLGRLMCNARLEVDVAVLWLRKGFALDSRNPNYPREIALCFEILQDFEQAAKWMQLSVDLAPKADDVTILKGQVKMYQGDRQGAYALFREAPRDSDYYPWALYFLTIDHLDNGRLIEARDLLLSARPSLMDTPMQVVDRSNSWMASLLACAYSRLGEMEKADKLIARLLDLYANLSRLGLDQAGFNYNDSCALAIRGDNEEALARLRKAADIGYDTHILRNRPEFDPILDDPEFLEIQSTVERKLAAQLASLRKMEASGEFPPIPVPSG